MGEEGEVTNPNPPTPINNRIMREGRED